MFRVNTGLIGAARSSRRGAGIWTLQDQIVYQRRNEWIGDLYIDNVSLLLHMDGSNGSTTFTDSSKNALAVTRFGNAQISTAQSKFGGSSGYFDGNGDYCTLAHNTAFNLSSGDFTIEAWIYNAARPSGVNTQTIIDKDGVLATSYPSYSITVDSVGLCLLNLGNGVGLSPTVTAYTIGTIPLATWTCIAATKSGTTIRTFLNGSLIASATQGVAMTDGSKSLHIGFYAGAGSSSYFNGYIDELRITKGVARYTDSYSLPDLPFPNL